MRAIKKGREPGSLIQHRLSKHCTYENFQGKAELRQALVSEQRGLCCYCMGRITDRPIKMKIEHWKCQAHHPEEQLNYKNLLGACLGREGKSPHEQHCDTRKGNNTLRWNPADPAHKIEARIFYEPDGSIRSHDKEFNSQLEKVLNLNSGHLKNRRKGALDGALEWLRQEKDLLKGPVTRERLQKQRDRLVEGSGALTPFIPVAIWLLEQRLSRNNR